MNAASVPLADDVAHVDWTSCRQLLVRQWHPGQHVTVLGPTGSGKTVLAHQLAQLRTYVQFWSIKSRDVETSALLRQGWSLTRDQVPDPIPGRPARWVVWPTGSTMRAARAAQRDVFGRLLDQAYRQGGWTLLIDELTYVTDDLGLIRDVRTALRTLRSDHVTVIACAQRPRRIPVEALTESSHIFVFRQPDSYDRDRLAELGGPLPPKELAAEVRALPAYHFLWIDRAQNLIRRSVIQR